MFVMRERLYAHPVYMMHSFIHFVPSVLDLRMYPVHLTALSLLRYSLANPPTADLSNSKPNKLRSKYQLQLNILGRNIKLHSCTSILICKFLYVETHKDVEISHAVNFALYLGFITQGNNQKDIGNFINIAKG